MRILCDENVKRSITRLLDQEGFEVVRVQDELSLGFSDRKIVDYCESEGFAFLTNDDDFFQFDADVGIFFLDDQGATARDTVIAIRRIERTAGEDAIEDHVWHVPDGWV